MSSGKWSGEDLILKLELLTRTARLALLQKNYSLVWHLKTATLYISFVSLYSLSFSLSLSIFPQVGRCTNEALSGTSGEGKLAELGEKKKKKRKKDTRCERELLSCICSLHGQALVAEGAGKTASVRAAMEAFLQSAKFVYSLTQSLLLNSSQNTQYFSLWLKCVQVW